MNLYPIWSDCDRIVHGESCMFAGTHQASLLFPVKKILRVYQPQSGHTFKDGVDYLWQPGSNELHLTEQSFIPALTKSELFPSKEKAILFPAPGNNAVAGGPDDTFLLFDNADFFARHQIEVDYEAATLDFPDLLQDQSHKLPRLRQKLSKGQPVEVVHLGDSISDGFNASGFVGIPPFLPTWSQQFVNYLHERYGSHIQYRNFAINGSGCLSALDIRALWMNRPADLLILAYGMNDTSLGTEVFLNALRLLITLARHSNPNVEILLVASMPANPMWQYVLPGSLQAQRDGMLKLASEYTDEVAVANVHDVYQECVCRKEYYSMTGNGINHPNDFGHRLYQAVLSSIL